MPHSPATLDLNSVTRSIVTIVLLWSEKSKSVKLHKESPLGVQAQVGGWMKEAGTKCKLYNFI